MSPSFLLCLLAGCVIVDPACDASAVGSVTVGVRSPNGGPVEAASVTWSVDGGRAHACDPVGKDGEWVCGWEVAGDLYIHVSADGYQDASISVLIEQGACHVSPRHVAVTLEPDMVCTDDGIVASIILTVVATDGGALSWTRGRSPGSRRRW